MLPNLTADTRIRTMFDIHHLRHFVAVAEERHFGRAAQRVGIAQPALTKSIKKLELLIKADLFDRAHQPVTLTNAGLLLLEEARRAIEQFRRVERVTQRIASGQAAEIRLGMVGHARPQLLPQVILEFRKRWP